MGTNGQEGTEEAILQALGHSERRNILKIIGASDGGVVYSDILAATGLNTGHLNYHLRGLEGLILSQEDKRYRLTPLGLKAIRMLGTLGEEPDGSVKVFVESKGAQKQEMSPLVRVILWILAIVDGIVFLAGLALLVIGLMNLAMNSAILGAGVTVVFGFILYLLLGALKLLPGLKRLLKGKRGG